MTTSLLGIVSSILTVKLIATATRWIATAKGSTLPETRDGINLYRIKWQFRAVAFAGGFFGIILCIFASRDSHSRPDGVSIGIAVAFVTAGLWIELVRSPRTKPGSRTRAFDEITLCSGMRSQRYACTRSKATRLTARRCPEASSPLPFECLSAPIS